PYLLLFHYRGKLIEHHAPAALSLFSPLAVNALMDERQLAAAAGQCRNVNTDDAPVLVASEVKSKHQPTWPVDLQVVAEVLSLSIAAAFSDAKTAANPRINLTGLHHAIRCGEQPARSNKRVEPGVKHTLGADAK